MNFYLGALLSTFAVTAVLIVPFINFLYRMKFTKKIEVAEKREGKTAEFMAIRKKHDLKAGTPTGLGILLVGVIVVMCIIFFPFLTRMRGGLVAGYDLVREVGLILFTFVGFGCLGLYDDVMKIFGFAKTGFFGLRRWHKFVIQWALAAAAAGWLYWGLGVEIVNVPFWGVVRLGWTYMLLAAFLIVTFANAFDITSGLDALGEGLLAICLLAFWAIAATQLDRVMSLFLAVWIGALLGGIYFTIYPARVFLGNASGMAFGATLALVGLLSGKVVALLVVGGVFLVDGGSSLVQILAKNIWHRRIFPIAPVHHWLELLGWEEPKIVARAWLAGIVLAIFGVWLAML